MPAPDLYGLLDPPVTAVLTMELQRGVAGDLSFIPALADAVRAAGTVEAAAEVCSLAREAGARVVHCTMEMRPDGAGYRANARMLGAWSRQRSREGRMPCETGSPEAELMPPLVADSRDLIFPRFSGVTPFMPSALDSSLRNLGIRTVVVTGVSLNMGIIGACIEAVNLGYDTVVVPEAVAGVPAEYGRAVLSNSIGILSTLVSLDDLRRTWSRT
jgi:nicotinamidase-related amidase